MKNSKMTLRHNNNTFSMEKCIAQYANRLEISYHLEKLFQTKIKCKNLSDGDLCQHLSADDLQTVYTFKKHSGTVGILSGGNLNSKGASLNPYKFDFTEVTIKEGNCRLPIDFGSSVRFVANDSSGRGIPSWRSRRTVSKTSPASSHRVVFGIGKLAADNSYTFREVVAGHVQSQISSELRYETRMQIHPSARGRTLNSTDVSPASTTAPAHRVVNENRGGGPRRRSRRGPVEFLQL